jgi:hypothetical protein
MVETKGILSGLWRFLVSLGQERVTLEQAMSGAKPDVNYPLA